MEGEQDQAGFEPATTVPPSKIKRGVVGSRLRGTIDDTI